MKSFLLMALCAILLLPSCKKEDQSGPPLEISGFGPAVFTGGEAISIYGSGFDPDPKNNTVSFNGVNGDVATATPNRLQVIVPQLASSGNLSVTVRGTTVTSAQRYAIVSLLQGIYNDNFILTADKQYLLRGDVVFNSKLIIQPGTVIYGEKATRAGLTARDVDFSGTAERPIVFTSDQPEGMRAPGDWKGVTINAQRGNQGAIPNGIMQYMRVEYAGYFVTTYNNNPFNFRGPYWGAALTITPTGTSTYKYLQVSYSAADGFSFSNTDNIEGGDAFFHHMVAFGCMGADFRVLTSRVKAQFGLGLKDPYLASREKSNGIVVMSSVSGRVNQFSNFTLVGYHPDARNILDAGLSVNNDAGSGVKVGNTFLPAGTSGFSIETFSLYNSVIAGSWKAGITIDGSNDYNWNNYEKTSGAFVQLRNNFITGTRPAQLPKWGGAFGRMNWNLISEPFYDISNDPKRVLFASLNDTTRKLSFSRAEDDLGIKGLMDYKRINNPGVLPAAGSVLLNSAIFPPGSTAFSPFFDKNTTWCGAFGTEDWTKPWGNFSPQTTKYIH